MHAATPLSLIMCYDGILRASMATEAGRRGLSRSRAIQRAAGAKVQLTTTIKRFLTVSGAGGAPARSARAIAARASLSSPRRCPSRAMFVDGDGCTTRLLPLEQARFACKARSQQVVTPAPQALRLGEPNSRSGVLPDFTAAAHALPGLRLWLPGQEPAVLPPLLPAGRAARGHLAGRRRPAAPAVQGRGGGCAAAAAAAANRLPPPPLYAVMPGCPPLHTPSFPVQVLATHDIGTVSWQACVLPTRQHALCLRVAEGSDQQPTELLLRAKSKEHVQQAVQQLAEHARRAASSQDSELEAAALEARLLAAGVQCPVPSRLAANPSLLVPADEPAGPDPRSLSFGSPVAEADMASGSRRSSAAGGCGDAAGQGSRANSPAALLEELESDWESDEEADVVCEGSGIGGGRGGGSYGAGDMHGVRQQPEAAGCTQAAAAGHGSHLLTSSSAPTSPVLPGLPLVARMAGTGAAATRRPSVSAPTSPSQAVVEGVEAQASPAPPSQLLPVRLLSFSGRPGGSSVQSHIQRLEAAVAQLGSELTRSRSAAGSLAASPSKQPAQGPAAAAEALALEEREQPTVAAGPLGRMPPAASEPSNASPANTSGGKGSREGSRQAEALAQENALLLEQLAAMQAELVRHQGQLSAAAADNIRLASQAAAAVTQLAAAADAMRGGQQREHELRASLAAAVGQCEAVGRELAGLSARVEAKEAQCRELRCA